MLSHDFIHIYSRSIALQDSELFIVRPVFLSCNNLIKDAIYAPYNKTTSAWYREDVFQEFMDLLRDSIIQPDWSLKNHLNDFRIQKIKLMSATNDLVTAVSSEPKERWLGHYLGYMELWNGFVPYIWIPWSIAYSLEDWFVKRLQEVCENWQEIYESLALPSKPIQMQQMIEQILEWKIKQGTDTELEEIRGKFGHLGGYSVNDKYWTKEEILEQVGQFSDPEKQLIKMQKEIQSAKERVLKILDGLHKKDEQLAKVAETIHEYLFLRTERIDVCKYCWINAGGFYRQIEKQFGLPFGAAAHFSCEEITRALESDELPDKQDIDNRLKYQYVVYITPQKTTVISDPFDQKVFLQKMIPNFSENQNIDKVCGKTAFPGKVTGRVRIVSHIKDISTMQKGEILVSNMTHPDYLGAIHKAIAIVTDEGGIICHASVVSRELKIPCIVGTKIATSVFHNGDIVEVDADNGIIKKHYS